MGFPGDDDVDIEVPATMGGTPDSCRLEDADDLCNIMDEDMESDNTALESRILWKRLRAAAVRLVLASAAADDAGARRSFCSSNIFRKSEMLSPSSAATELELPPPVVASVMSPEPG
jgi:hypothetical protein